jgi:hypothetical protein
MGRIHQHLIATTTPNRRQTLVQYKSSETKKIVFLQDTQPTKHHFVLIAKLPPPS